MLRPRIIVSLLINNGRLVKTINFRSERYIGDPLNAVRIFNEKQCDELVIYDIAASKNNLAPNFNLLEKIASVSNMPLCYGGVSMIFLQQNNWSTLALRRCLYLVTF